MTEQASDYSEKIDEERALWCAMEASDREEEEPEGTALPFSGSYSL